MRNEQCFMVRFTLGLCTYYKNKCNAQSTVTKTQ